MTHTIAWKRYTILLAETWLAFFMATFAIALYFSRFTHGVLNLLIGAGLVGLYLFVIASLIYRLIKQLPIAALMLLVPIAPLVILLFLVTLVPLIQKLI